MSDNKVLEPRRTRGAVVESRGHMFVVVKDGEGSDVQRPLFGHYDAASRDDDVFRRWADFAECARHGIPYEPRECGLGARSVAQAEADRDAALKRAEAAERAAKTEQEDAAREREAKAGWIKRAEAAEAEVARLRGLLEKRPEPYTPRVGDVVGFGGVNKDDDNPRVVTSIDGDHAWVRYGKSGVRVRLKTSLMVFLRPATPAERAAAGLTPAEAAVATEKPVEPEAPAQPQVLPEHLAWMEADAAWACSSWSTDFDAPENKKRYDEAILAARALRAAVARRDGGQK